MDGGANTGYRELLQVVADPNRWRILTLLSTGSRTVGELVGSLEVAQSSVSHHLARLREAGLIEAVAEGRARRYGWAAVVPGSVQSEVQHSLRRWIGAASPDVAPRGRARPAPRSIEVHLL